jgi:hypothetical protein
LNNGSVCNTATGACLAGIGCQDHSSCQKSDSDDKCFMYGRQCVCDTHDKPTGSDLGTCRLRKGPCEECTSDVECGDDAQVFGPPDGIGFGKCKALDGSGKKYCLYQKVGQCGCGNVDDGTGLCKPQSNNCAAVGCTSNTDCPSSDVCSAKSGTGGCGVCVPRCRWDFLRKQLVEPGCGPGQTCWVDSENLSPDSPNFGAGRCKPACQSDADCLEGTANPFGGTKLKCAAEATATGFSDKRCRPKGDCMDSLECPPLDPNQPNVGYCDRATFSCKSDCRVGADPVTGLPYRDCRVPYACSNNTGAPVCKLQNCAEQGGAEVACSRGEYCCGDDKNHDGLADACPPSSQQNEVGCYVAPVPPFCAKCTKNDECLSVGVPSWMTCSNGAKNPSCAPFPASCINMGKRAGGADGVSICAIPTLNDLTSTPLGQRKDLMGCPVGYAVTSVRPRFHEKSNCETNADCNLGTDAGSCEPDPELPIADGGLEKSCRCAVGSGSSQCPNSSADGGVTSVCKAGQPGARAACIVSMACVPKGADLYKNAADSGCGF